MLTETLPRLLLPIVVLAACGPASAVSTTIAPDDPVMKLDEIGIYEVGCALRDHEWRQFPVGWNGFFDEEFGIACQPSGEQGGRSAFLLHAPWKKGAGTVYQQFTFRFPWARQITLTGATAMRSDIIGKSDGVVFRIYVNGVKKLETLRKAASWQPFKIDLTGLKSKTAVVRFETDSGPKDDSGWDYSLWGDRQITLKGFRPRGNTRPDPPPLDLTRMSSARNGSVAPLDGFGGTCATMLKNNSAILNYTGPDGELQYRWNRPEAASDPVLGKIELRAKMKGDKEVAVPVAGAARIEWTEPAQFVGSQWEELKDGAACISEYNLSGKTVTLRTEARMVGKSLALEVTCGEPVVAAFDPGGWGPVIRRRTIPVPYCSVPISYLPAENLFVSTFLDWTDSAASRHEGSLARYIPLTDGSRSKLKDRVIYSAAWHLDEVLPNIPNAPSPFIKDVGGRIVLDIWGGKYTDIAKSLETLHDYGIRNCTALIHVWQRSGYDNALPMHIPAAADLGGDEGMKTLVETGRRLGYLIALHENYVDYYPNYDHFSENDISLDPSGNRVNAWFNPGTKIQSFAVKPNSILALAETQSPEIHKRYGTNSCYLDVHSAVQPWFHVDFRAGEQGAGRFERVWNTHRELWDYERRVHGGPVFGEGNAHWYWSGALDGVEAQFGTGWGHRQGETAPLAVDFDLLRIHPLQINHGMGYYERWSEKIGWGSLPPTIALDQYRMQEVIYNHAGFLGAANWSNVGHAWLEHHLLTPVMSRYCSARPSEITYHVNGKWVDSSTAAKAGDWTRPRIKYDNGLILVANDSPERLDLGGLVLPRFGWLAKGAGVTAYTALRDDVVVDYAETQDTVFANARDAAFWNAGNIRRIRPAVGGFEQTGPREFRALYLWFADEKLDTDYHCFVHFVAPGDTYNHYAIHFQDDHALARPTSQWQPGDTVRDGPHVVTIPNDVKDGDYIWTVGLFTPGGPRVPLLGVQDNESRIRVGVIHVRNGGKTITFDPEKRPGDERLKLYSQHLNQSGKMIDFGTVRTNGSVMVRREADKWVLQTLPREKPFQIELSVKRFGLPTEVRCTGGTTATLVPVESDGYWKLQMNGATEYSWQAIP